MKIYHFFLLLALSPYNLLCQKTVPDFGEIERSDLEIKKCSFESDADAMKLIDIKETEFSLFSYGTKLKIEHRVRIKIFNERGYKYANISIPYISKKGIGKIKDIRGIVYTLDESGKITIQKLDKKDIFNNMTFENLGTVNFTFPSLKPGSIIEYRYTRIENNMIQIDPWEIQGDIPVGYTSAVITTPISSDLKEKLYGIDTFSRTVELLKYDQFRRTSYFTENVKSFKPEPFMSSYKDNLTRMVFFHLPKNSYLFSSLSSSQGMWNFVGNYLLESEVFGGKIKKAIPGSEVIIDSAKKIVSQQDRIKFIYEAVKQRVPNKSLQTLYSEDLVEAWNTRSGNSADINLILLNLLAKSDIKCFPLLISTRENARIDKTFPSFSQLNGVDVIAMIDSIKYYVLDASLKFQSIDVPPVNIINREALLLKPNNILWVIVNENRPLFKENINLFCDLNEKGILESDATIQYYSYSKIYLLDSSIETGKEESQNYFDSKIPSLSILSSNRTISENDEDPLFETVQFNYQTQQTGDFYFLNPWFFSKKRVNPFINENRNFDIDLVSSQEIVYSSSITLPDLFEIEHLPKTITLRAPDSSISFTRRYSIQEKKLFMTQILELKRAVFIKEEYPGLKDFFTQMYALMNEETIFKKKKN